MQHAAAIVVPIATGFILTMVGYQVPFLIACVFASLTFLVTRRLAPAAPAASPAEPIDAAAPGAQTTAEIEDAVAAGSN
jgi:MFS family permease